MTFFRVGSGRSPLTWMFLLFAVTCFLSGCRPASVTSSSRTLVYGRGEDANTLDPINTDIGEAVKVIVNIYDTLVSYGDDSLELAPSLATAWESSDDGLTWNFKLRENVRFHDGTPFNADAVVFSFERLIQEDHPDVHDPARPYRPSYSMIASIEAVSPHEVRFQLHRPSALFLKNIAMFPASIVSPTAVRKSGKDYATQPVGTGPFRLARWTREQQLVLQANDEHWRGRAGVDYAIFVPISESATRVQQLTRGALHMADDLPPGELELLAKTPGIVLQQETGLNVAYLAMQTEKRPLGNLKVRQAIAHAINKSALVDVAYAGRAQPAKTMVPPSMWAYHDGIQDREFDPAQARALMEAAAADEGFTLPLKLSLAVMAQSRPYLQQPLRVASLLKDSLAPIGIEVEIDPKPVNQHFVRLMAGRFELGLAGWTSDNSDPDNFLYSLLDPDNIGENGNNLSRYRSERVHSLLISAQSELDAERRKTLYLEAQEQIFADVPVVPLAHAQINVAQRAEVKGYRLHPSSLVYLRQTRLEGPP